MGLVSQLNPSIKKCFDVECAAVDLFMLFCRFIPLYDQHLGYITAQLGFGAGVFNDTGCQGFTEI